MANQTSDTGALFFEAGPPAAPACPQCGSYLIMTNGRRHCADCGLPEDAPYVGGQGKLAHLPEEKKRETPRPAPVVVEGQEVVSGFYGVQAPAPVHPPENAAKKKKG